MSYEDENYIAYSITKNNNNIICSARARLEIINRMSKCFIILFAKFMDYEETYIASVYDVSLIDT